MKWKPSKFAKYLDNPSEEVEIKKCVECGNVFSSYPFPQFITDEDQCKVCLFRHHWKAVL